MGGGTSAAILDEERLQREYEDYQIRLDKKIEEAYVIAKEAKSKNLDFSDSVEIPRAADLASRTEKLLENPYLYPNPEDKSQEALKIEGVLRNLLENNDRETAAIMIAKSVTNDMFSITSDKQRSIDSGLRVGLAVLTEAVLVAPLDGIGDVRILNNVDGSEFLSIDFCGPIRAAGGTAQAMGVLIGDILRREMGIGRYMPTKPEVERVKEEFGLYRMNLQYKPPPEETEIIVNACPVMINGEETERMECAGYKEVRNVVNDNGSYRTRVRGGVMLVIGEGLCLKAPKIQTHTERLRVPGWEFISQFAKKGESAESPDGVMNSRVIPKEERYMGDIIAGRPVFGEPREPGGFRLRYGRSRATGLAAAGLNPITMKAMGGFLSVGTQMKIEGPGKACAVTPCVEIDGPTLLLEDGSFVTIRTDEQWKDCKDRVVSIWDSGEILMGFGEFLENNKRLVPSSYSIDWWSADIAEALDSHEKVEEFARLVDLNREDMPPGIPYNGAINRGGEDPVQRLWRHGDWISYIRSMDLDWENLQAINSKFGAAVPPPWNLWWSDLPVQFLPLMSELLLLKGSIDSDSLRIKDSIEGWPFNLTNEEIGIGSPVIGEWPRWTEVWNHGVVKSSLMVLGLEHFHDGPDIVIPRYWEGLLEGLGLEGKNGEIGVRNDVRPHVEDFMQGVTEAASIVSDEDFLEGEITNPELKARELIDDYMTDMSLHIVRLVSTMRWEDAVPCRIGARMGRPEKSGIREMKPLVHAIYPIGENGGPQRLISQASAGGAIRVVMGPRVCETCGRETPHLICHHRPDNDIPQECGGGYCSLC